VGAARRLPASIPAVARDGALDAPGSIQGPMGTRPRRSPFRGGRHSRRARATAALLPGSGFSPPFSPRFPSDAPVLWCVLRVPLHFGSAAFSVIVFCFVCFVYKGIYIPWFYCFGFERVTEVI